MKRLGDLRIYLKRIDGKSYRLYKETRGRYEFPGGFLSIDHVQGDPFATPSTFSLHIPLETTGFPPDTFSSKSREIALRDYLARSFSDAINRHARGRRGTGKSGTITIDTPGQQVLERTAITIEETTLVARFTMALPGFGRRIAAENCIAMITDELPRIAGEALYFESHDSRILYRHIETAENADHLRSLLAEKGLISFIADGSLLPRRSGIDDRPLGRDAVAFTSPPSLRLSLELPSGEKVEGMGIPAGVTLIAGGGYHGKSTLLGAIELGIYNHIPGDGRERVVTRTDAVKIRGEDGRRIEGVSITPFISNLPGGEDTGAFRTENASGSTSQAANIMEALEAGAGTLLIDEDTSATNFMIRDHRMQCLVAKKNEPITPFIDRVRQLHHKKNISTILVMGGSGDYFDVADLVIAMESYRPADVTKEARRIAAEIVTNRVAEAVTPWEEPPRRVPLAASIDPSRGKKQVKVAPRSLKEISFGSETIDLSAMEQIVHESQTRAIGDALVMAKGFMDNGRSIEEILQIVMDEIERRGLTILPSYRKGAYAAFRKFELAAALNRLRSLQVSIESS